MSQFVCKKCGETHDDQDCYSVRVNETDSLNGETAQDWCMECYCMNAIRCPFCCTYVALTLLKYAQQISCNICHKVFHNLQFNFPML